MARPSLKFTAKQRSQVAASAAAGMSHEEISLALGISRNTLEKHFEHELSVGAYRKRMEANEALCRMAKKGSVPAIRMLLQQTPRAAAPPQEAKAPKKGKKEQQQDDAVVAQVGTEWEDILPRPSQLQ